MKSKARFVLDKKNLLEQYNIAKELGDKVSYSFKTNPFIGTILEKETKCMFSVHSKNLLYLIKDKERDIYVTGSHLVLNSNSNKF